MGHPGVAAASLTTILAQGRRRTLYVASTKLFGLKLSNPKEISWIVAIFFLALSLLLPSRLLLLVI
jgi:hypothetical protein